MIKTDTPIFIGGAGRSGTTLIRVILDSHPRIACGPELRITPTLAYLWEQYNQRLDVLKSYGITKESNAKTFQNLYFALISRYLNTTQKRRIAEKTPGNCKVFPQLRQIFPDSPLIHIIRDGRDVVASLRKQNWIDLRTGEPMVETVDTVKAIKHWKESVTLGRKIKNQKDQNYFEIRYESLIESPELELKKLFKFLNEDWDPKVLSFHEISRNLAFEASSNQVNKPFYKTSIGRFRKALQLEDGLKIDDIAGDLLIDLGYTLDNSWIKSLQPNQKNHSYKI